RVDGQRGVLSGDAADELGDLGDVLGLVRAERELDGLMPVEMRRATFGNVVAEERQEVVGKLWRVTLDLVDREDEQVARRELTGRDKLGLGLLELARVDVRPASTGPQRAPNPLAADRTHRMLRRQLKPVACAHRRDVDELPAIAA